MELLYVTACEMECKSMWKRLCVCVSFLMCAFSYARMFSKCTCNSQVFFFFSLEKGRGEGEGKEAKEKKFCWASPSMYFFFFLPKLLLLSLPCYPYLFFTGTRDYFDKIIGRGFDFFFSSLHTLRILDFSFLDPSLVSLLIKFSFPFLTWNKVKR